jgi:hypothetical protein
MFKNPLAIAALLGGGFLLLRSKSTAPSTTTPPVISTPPILATGQGGGKTSPPPNYLEQGTKLLDAAGNVLTTGQNILDQLFPPKTAPTTLPVGPPSTISTAPGTPQILLDRFGMPHIGGQESVDRANRSGDDIGQLYRRMSDQYRLFYEDLEVLVAFDMSQTGNSWLQVINWYKGDINRLQATINGYNQAHPQAPMTPRG